MGWRQIAVAVMTALLLVAPAYAQGNGSSVSFATGTSFVLTISGGGLGGDVEERVWFGQLPFGQSSRWVVRHEGEDSNSCGRLENHACIPTATKVRRFVDARFCPALSGVLQLLIKVRTVEGGSTHSIVTDVPLVSLVTYHGPTMETERLAEYTGPLVEWWQSAQEQLKSCWTDRPPPEA